MLSGCTATSPSTTTQRGYLPQQMECDIQKEVDILVDAHPSDLSQECRYLLELPHRPSALYTSVHEAYWILATKVA
jgi:hypothetical protein